MVAALMGSDGCAWKLNWSGIKGINGHGVRGYGGAKTLAEHFVSCFLMYIYISFISLNAYYSMMMMMM